MPVTTPDPAPKPLPSLHEIITSAIIYWEKRRYYYNGILIAFFAFKLIARVLNPGSMEDSTAVYLLPNFKFTFRWVILTVASANIVYCSVYVADLFMQLSDFRAKWIEDRWFLFFCVVIYAMATYV